MVLSALAALVVPAAAAATGTEGWARGVLMPRVATLADKTQTYALYIPPTYNASRPAPLLICFDPGGQGAVPVSLFKSAADNYGVVVIGSNNSRNGPLEPALSAGLAIWDDITARLSIDPRRIYAAGFSGGAQMAMEIGFVRAGKLAGVIVSGNGPMDTRAKISEPPFELYLLAGSADFNRLKTGAFAELLDKGKRAHRFRIFPGKHEWPDGESLQDGWEWLEGRAMSGGLRALNEPLRESIAERWLERARAAEKSSRWLDARDGYEATSQDWTGTASAATAAGELARVLKSAVYKKALKEQQQDVGRESMLLGALRQLLTGPSMQPIDPLNRRRMISGLGLEGLKRRSTDGSERALQRGFDFAYQAGFDALLAKDVERAVIGLSIAVEIEPDSPFGNYNLACALTRHGERALALRHLAKAIESGRFTFDAILRDEDFAPLHGDLTFQQLVRPRM